LTPGQFSRSIQDRAEEQRDDANNEVEDGGAFKPGED
jgi:hypothetical protein